MNVTVRQTLTVRAVLTFIVGPAVFVALGIVMILGSQGDVSGLLLGIVCIVFFGGGAAFALWRNFGSGRDLLVVDDDGIRGLGRVGVGRWSLPWSQVDAVYAVTQRTGHVTVQHLAVGVTGTPEHSGTGRMARMTSGLVDVPVNAADRMLSWNPGIKPSIDEVLAAVAARGVPVVDKR